MTHVFPWLRPISTTFFGHMIGYWILIGLKNVCYGITTCELHSDWLIAVTWASLPYHDGCILKQLMIVTQQPCMFSFIYMVEVVEKLRLVPNNPQTLVYQTTTSEP